LGMPPGFSHGFHALRYLEEGQPPPGGGWRTVRRAFAYLRPHLRASLLLLLLIAAATGLGLVPPLLVKRILDTALPRRRADLLDAFALGMVVAPALAGLTSVGQTFLTSLISQRVIHRLRVDMYRHMQALSLRYFTRVRSGETVSRLVSDAGGVQDVLVTTLVGLVTNSALLIATVGVMASMNGRLTVAALLVLPLFALPVSRVGRARFHLQSRTQAALADLAAHVGETLSLSGALLVRSFGAEQREAERFAALSARIRDLAVRQSLVGRWLFTFVSVLSTAGPAVIYWIGGREVLAGRMTVGGVVAFAAYLLQMYGPASNLVNLQVNFRGALALFARIFDVLDQPAEVREAARPVSLPRLTGAIAFDDVRFAYDPGRPVLRGISFRVEPGQMVALVGPSGAGKTTIIMLLARFFDPDAGRITLDGVDLRELSFATLRRDMALVTQEPVLFHATIRDNVRYARPAASDTEVLAALRAAQLEETVARLPHGLDTLVGERGYRLSGGEKQRVAIARAFLADPRVLVLDEATSSLDSHAERLIQEALDRLLAGRTAVVIAHRLSTVVSADQILVVDDGRIVERGRHDELRARGGLYATLYREQFERGAALPGAAAERTF
jgi:ATP-binding cassette subfamily B protein